MAASVFILTNLVLASGQPLVQWEEDNCFAMPGNPQDCHYEGAFVCFGAFPGHPKDGVVGQGAAGYCHKPSSSFQLQPTTQAVVVVEATTTIHGSLDKIWPNDDGSVTATGWAVDRSGTGNGRPSVKVGIAVDGKVVWSTVANISRPDLVKAGVAPDPNHGYMTDIPPNIAKQFGIATGSTGNHTVTAVAWPWNDSNQKQEPTPIGNSKCIADGRALISCGGAPIPMPWSCCRSRANVGPPTPAPPRISKQYPFPRTTRPPPGKANVVLILTDDQDKMLGSLDGMNTTKNLFEQGGAVFNNFFVTTPICCPSRISLLSGRWAHNTGAVATTAAGWCAIGKYWKAPMQNHSLPTYVRAAGVTTGIFGKETNANDATTISPGWDRFFVLGGSDEGHYYGNWWADQGRRWDASIDDYMTDLIQDRALAFINAQIKANKQFFAYIAPHAPHTRATPPPFAQNYFVDKVAPRFASWNRTLPDHHWLVRTQPPMTSLCAGYSDQLYRNRLQALLGVDALVEAVADTLLAANVLDSTYFLYTSDHGFHLGEMSMPYFKAQPYDTDIRVPFMIRGPGIQPGLEVNEIGLNVDIAPTIAGLFHTAPPPESLVDGHSLLPLLFRSESESNSKVDWRNDFVFEFWAGGKTGSPPATGPYCAHHIMAVNNTYQGVRTAAGLKYVDFRPYEDIEEAFNTTADPFEMANLAKDPASQAWINTLRARLGVLRNCTLDECW